MDHPQRTTSGDASNATSASSNLMPNVLFREIHKNAFLKRHSSDRRAGFPRKSDRVWVVFCVHDDIEPFLEIYPDQKVALTHKPEWFASLSNVLHVSPTICGHEDEYEFAITLSFQVVRLSAPSWEAMMEWVETIRNKLRELKVLCPKENIYSKMPEQKQPLLPTRDPNSPLPLPPEGPSTLLPGVEIVHVENRVNPLVTETHENGRHRRISHSRNNELNRRIINNRLNPVERDPNSVVETTQPNESSSTSTAGAGENPVERSLISNPNLQENKIRVRKAAPTLQTSSSTSGIPAASNITVIEVSTPSQSDYNAPPECNPSDSENDEKFGNPVNRDLGNEETTPKHNTEETHYEHVFLSNVPIGKTQFQSPQIKAASNCIPINVNRSKKTHSANLLIGASSSTQTSSQDNSIASTSNLSLSSNSKDVLGSSSACTNTGKNLATEECERSDNNPLSPQIQSKLERVNIAGLIPRVPAKSVKVSSFKPSSPMPKDLNLNTLECKKCSHENGCSFLPSAENPEALTNGESSTKASASGISIPAYSQVKKVPKGKAKNEESKNEEHSSQKASPVIPKRKVTDVQMLEVESEGSRRPESTAVPKNQPNSFDAKTSHNAQPSGSSKQECGNANSNNEMTRNFPLGQNNEQRSLEGPSTSGNPSQINLTRKESVAAPNNTAETEPITAIVQQPVGVISVEDIPLIGGHQRRRRRSSSSDPAPTSVTQSSRGIGGADRIRINVPNNSAREIHRYEDDIRPPCRNRCTTELNSLLNLSSQSARLTLREKQVIQLKKEILHPGGIRLQLRKKDCTGSIALVDVLNGVCSHPFPVMARFMAARVPDAADFFIRKAFIDGSCVIDSSKSLRVYDHDSLWDAVYIWRVAGWKQKEHPLLYNALHIGDQLISIGDAVVRNSTEAQKLIRSSTRPYIEFIIRRVPFGNVLALQRSSEGQSLGIIQEGNTAEIKDVVPYSLAARQGLTSKTLSSDGLSLTTWFLTEINGRPLNLFFKDNEVKDRLNAVGKEISILVQPYDFIKQIKKQLKNFRSYKDYIVQ